MSKKVSVRGGIVWALLSTLIVVGATAQGPSSAPWDVEMSDGQRIVFDGAPRAGRCTAENWGPDTVVFEIQELRSGRWVRKTDFAVKPGASSYQDFDLEKGERLTVRTLSRSNPKAEAKGRVVVPW